MPAGLGGTADASVRSAILLILVNLIEEAWQGTSLDWRLRPLPIAVIVRIFVTFPVELIRRTWGRARFNLRFRPWPSTAVVLVVALLVIVVIVMRLAIEIRPSVWPPAAQDQWNALAALFAAGAFLLAVVGTVVATVAYVNSTKKPSLIIDSLRAPGLDSLWELHWRPGGEYGFVAEWRLSLTLWNLGTVAARFVAVRVALYADRRGARPQDQPRDPKLHPVSGREGFGSWMPVGREFNWEGGADRVIHPQWRYEIPPLEGTLDVQENSDVGFFLYIIANDHQRIDRQWRLKYAVVEAGPKSNVEIRLP